MKYYQVEVSDRATYDIVAENAEEAQAIALDWFAERMPQVAFKNVEDVKILNDTTSFISKMVQDCPHEKFCQCCCCVVKDFCFRVNKDLIIAFDGTGDGYYITPIE